ncbi:MAG: hypothetical protein OXH98_16035 [Caldilineaceae bacterium]|nr:hypothetical protein [Caldilineaceae bacterium]
MPDSIPLSVFASPGVALILGAVFMKHKGKAVYYTILSAAVPLAAAFLASCALITPEPSTPTPTFPLADCYGGEGYQVLLPGQSAKDPIEDWVEDYTDIVGVESSLEGERLTVVFYLRDLSEPMELNKKGVAEPNFEILWFVDIDVDADNVEFRALEEQLDDYRLEAAYPGAKISSSDGERPVRSIEYEIVVVLMGIRRIPETTLTEWWHVEEVASQVFVSHEDHAVTVVSDIPGITPSSHLRFYTSNSRRAADGVTCPPD